MLYRLEITAHLVWHRANPQQKVPISMSLRLVRAWLGKKWAHSCALILH